MILGQRQTAVEKEKEFSNDKTKLTELDEQTLGRVPRLLELFTVIMLNT